MAENVNVIDLLLRPDAPEVTKARKTAKYEVKRLSEAFGAPFTVEVRGLSYNQLADIREMGSGDADIVLAGVTSPNLRDPRLLEAYKAATPAELVKAIFLPGELGELCRAIERLTGFRGQMLVEVKKN